MPKEIPKLPKDKSLRGKIFDDWNALFNAKMSQAKISDLLEPDFIKPVRGEIEYESFKIKADFLKNHLLTAIIGSNANSFVNPKTMDGIDMYNKLLEVFQGEDHEKDKAVNAATEFEKLRFGKGSNLSPEAFLAKINECLKRMEVPDGHGGTTKPVSDILLPSLFRAKIHHPTYETWKEISETNKEEWKDIQISFLRVADRNTVGKHEQSDKFRTSNQTMDINKKALTKDELSEYNRALSKGLYVRKELFHKLSKNQKEKIKSSKDKQKQDKGDGRYKDTVC